jgi:ATP-dependent helicase HrpA
MLPPNLEEQIAAALPRDQHRFWQRLRQIHRAKTAGRPFDRNLNQLLAQVGDSVALRADKQSKRPAVSFPPELPITARAAEIAAAVRDHQVIIVSGETGSGKSTQLPKICLDLGRGVDGLIGHTQPRRIAARSVAGRIAEELGVPLGAEVGYKIRFADTTSPRTYIKLMTDGILLAETQLDRRLLEYDTIIVDEAHERSLNIDFLLGYLKQLLPSRSDLRVIITSATIDAQRFSEHFASEVGPAPVIEVSGRGYPVEVRYRPLVNEDEDGEADLESAVLAGVDEALASGPGDILIFMPTERDILSTSKALRGRSIAKAYSESIEVLPLYARLSTADQNRVFQAHSARRIVIATNVAESSLTVPGIRYVIDPGTARVSRYSARSKVQRLPIEAVSQASADQRKGRCGRVGPGVCIRLYSEDDFLARDRFTAPEIQRSNLAAVILQIEALKLGDIYSFPFLDPPRPESIRDGYRTLAELRAVDDDRRLTELGRRLSRMPVDPRIGRIILAGAEEGCLQETLIIASALELQDPRERPIEKQEQADIAHAQFADEQSDFLSYLKLWDFYHHLKRTLSQNQLRRACRQNFLSYNRLREWLDIHRQLVEIVGPAQLKGQTRRDDYAAIHRALLPGFLSAIALRGEGYEYLAAGGNRLHLWPGSGVFAAKPKWVVGAELVETSKRYLRTVAKVEPVWIERAAEHLLHRCFNDVHWDARGGTTMAFERVTLFGLPIVPRRRVHYARHDRKLARELFIQHGLVEGQLRTTGKFLEQNQALLLELERLQVKARKRDLLVGPIERYEFYDRRIPTEVYDSPTFERWLKGSRARVESLLAWTPTDLLREPLDDPTAAAFPEAIEAGRVQLPISYRFEPGAEDDGVTLTVPQEALGQVDAEQIEWLVPGLLQEKIVAMIRSLPKTLRRKFVPAPDTAKTIVPHLRFGEGNLSSTLAAALSRQGGERITRADFQAQQLPEYLRMNVRVVDGEGTTVAASRDVNDLRRQLMGDGTLDLQAIDDRRWNRQGIASWDFGDLPPFLEIQRRKVTVRVYPALADDETSVAQRLYGSPEIAQRVLRSGVRRLFVLSCQKELRAQVEWMPKLRQMSVQATGLIDARGLQQAIYDLIVERGFLASDIPTTEAEFRARLEARRERIGVGVQEIATLLPRLIEAHHKARLELESATAAGLDDVVFDVRQQLAELTPTGFLTATPWRWLQRYPKYFQAIEQRLQKVSSGAHVRDRALAPQIKPLWENYLELAARHRSQHVYSPQLENFRWLLEELRISLFAQQLGTAVPVSAKRLQKAWDELR